MSEGEYKEANFVVLGWGTFVITSFLVIMCIFYSVISGLSIYALFPSLGDVDNVRLNSITSGCHPLRF